MRAQAISRVTLRRGATVASVATILALFFATKDSFHQLSLGLPIHWGKNLWWKAMEWYAWGLLSPLIFIACRRFDFSAKPSRTVLVHLVFGALVSVLHC